MTLDQLRASSARLLAVAGTLDCPIQHVSMYGDTARIYVDWVHFARIFAGHDVSGKMEHGARRCWVVVGGVEVTSTDYRAAAVEPVVETVTLPVSA